MTEQQILTVEQTVSQKSKKGFTLTEIAIVLGIIGLILGSVWAAASSVYKNMKISDTERAITSTAQSVRSMFAASGTTGQGSATEITAPGMFPVSWGTVVGAINDPWNGLAKVYGNGPLFTVELAAVPPDACAALLNYFSLGAATKVVGLVGTSAIAASAAATLGSTGVAPKATDFTATANCVAAKPVVQIGFDIAQM